MGSTLEITDLHVRVEEKEILKGISMTINTGETHALMGPNGSGKSTLASALMGHPAYEITSGEVTLNGESVLEMSPDERARKGLFLAFQYPSSIPGVSMQNFLRQAHNAVWVERHGPGSKPLPAREFRALLNDKLKLLRMSDDFLRRYLNEGFSGGEKKRAEILQMAILEPRFAVLDETDSGLDIDALRTVGDGVNAQRGPNLGCLVITHYPRLLNYIKPEFVHIMLDGRIATSGGFELALDLDEKGYDWVRDQFGHHENGHREVREEK
jgi:Fe-S cluster assembly ATP-binding protein